MYQADALESFELSVAQKALSLDDKAPDWCYKCFCFKYIPPRLSLCHVEQSQDLLKI